MDGDRRSARRTLVWSVLFNHGAIATDLHASHDAAMQHLASKGFAERDDDAVAKLFGLPSFKRGLFAADLWRRVSDGETSFARANQALSDYDGHCAARSYVGARVAQAFFSPQDDRITLIADRIEPGREAAVFLHEIVHKRGARVVGEAGMRRLVDGVKGWASSPLASMERRIHDVASAKARAAAGSAGAVHDEELFAYAVE